MLHGQQAGVHIDGLAWKIRPTSPFLGTEYPLTRAYALLVAFLAHSRVHAGLRTGAPLSHARMLVTSLPRLEAGAPDWVLRTFPGAAASPVSG